MFLFVLFMDHSSRMLSLFDGFKAERETVWHCVNFVDRRITFKPNLFLGKKTLLRVADIGSSSHFRIYLVVIQSRVSKPRLEIYRLWLDSMRFLKARSGCIAGFYFGRVKVIY